MITTWETISFVWRKDDQDPCLKVDCVSRRLSCRICVSITTPVTTVDIDTLDSNKWKHLLTSRNTAINTRLKLLSIGLNKPQLFRAGKCSNQPLFILTAAKEFWWFKLYHLAAWKTGIVRAVGWSSNLTFRTWFMPCFARPVHNATHCEGRTRYCPHLGKWSMIWWMCMYANFKSVSYAYMIIYHFMVLK